MWGLRCSIRLLLALGQGASVASARTGTTMRVTPVDVAVLPAGGFVVPFLLIAAKLGYREMFEPAEEPTSGTPLSPRTPQSRSAQRLLEAW